jgi:hypothetical protein
MFKAVVLKICVKIALMAVQNKQPVPPYLTRLCMRVKMLQPLQPKRVVCPAVLRDRELPIAQYICFLVLGRDVDAPFVDNKRQGHIPSSADALDNSNLLAIA